ncbi:MAG TPA: protein kinase, partial [Terriglobales bacterium]|nr:protein kinase [Terriglobales bacterium]
MHVRSTLPPNMSGQFAPGETLGHYRIVEKIGEGGMGEVYRAHDEHLDCDVALKVLPQGSVGNESARKQFHKEARVLARLNHPNIAIVHDFDTQQGVDYLVMEYIAGTTLSEKLVNGKLPGGLYSGRQMEGCSPQGIVFRWPCRPCRQAARPRPEQSAQLRTMARRR